MGHKNSRLTAWVVSGGITLFTLLLMAAAASAHDWYTQRQDPVHGYGCCGGHECHAIPAKWLIQEGDGYRVRLTLEQTRQINPQSQFPIDTLIARARVQTSEEANFAICLFATNRTAPTFGVICLFEPPAT